MVVLVIAAIFLQVRLWVGESSFAHVNGLMEQVENKNARIQLKEERNRILLAETLELKSGLDAVEEIARSELGMIKSGETFYLVLDQSESKKGIRH
ncbi:MAG: septum formation initiator family protein [Gammaproteobacteria bacterium]|nr:septum formation initiator family protein [Gammaproteobacteria bacterium]